MRHTDIEGAGSWRCVKKRYTTCKECNLTCPMNGWESLPMSTEEVERNRKVEISKLTLYHKKQARTRIEAVSGS